MSDHENPQGLFSAFSQAEQAMGVEAYQAQVVHTEAHANHMLSLGKVADAKADFINRGAEVMAFAVAVLAPALAIRIIRKGR